MTEIPLSKRVTAPVSAVATPVSGISWRPARKDDLDAIAGVAREMSLEDHPNFIESRDEVEETLFRSWIDLERDTLVATSASGEILAYGIVELSPSHETAVRSLLYGGVAPAARGRGIGRALIAWQESRARQQLASSAETMPGWIQVHADERAVSSVHSLERAGFSAVRWFRAMDRVLSEPLPSLALPAGLSLEQFTMERSAQTRDAKNDSFRDHWGSQPTPDEVWEATVTISSFRPDLSWLALAGDKVVGLVMTFVDEDDWELAGYSSGYIGLVGVVREWRRKGVAPALLATAMESFRAAGLERASLDVDSESPSGADTLYTGMGFFETTTSMAFTKVF